MPLYLSALMIIYSICLIFDIDNVKYAHFFTNVSNSIVFTTMAASIIGAMLGTCKLEYMKSVRKIKKEIENNCQKINYLKTKDKFIQENSVSQNIDYRHSKLNKDTEKKVDLELKRIKLEVIKTSVEEILETNNQIFEEIENIQLIEPIDIKKIRENVLIKRKGK